MKGFVAAQNLQHCVLVVAPSAIGVNGHLAARNRQRVDDGAGSGFPQPIAHLVLVRLQLVRLGDVRVIPQAVEQLRSIGLRVNRLQFDALKEGLFLGPLGLGRACLPKHRPCRAEGPGI